MRKSPEGLGVHVIIEDKRSKTVPGGAVIADAVMIAGAKMGVHRSRQMDGAWHVSLLDPPEAYLDAFRIFHCE